MPARLWGVPHIGDEVWPLAKLVDQSWMRSAVRSHGSAPDRKSRAVSSV